MNSPNPASSLSSRAATPQTHIPVHFSTHLHPPRHPPLPPLHALLDNPGTPASGQRRPQHPQQPQQPGGPRVVSNNVVPTLGAPRLKQGQQQGNRGDHHHQQQQQHQAQQQQPQFVLEPMSKLDVDQDLWQVLDLCSDDELESIYELLYAPSPFSPMIKSLVSESEPALLGLRGRLSVMHKIEARFRFLAADSASLLHGRRPSYRDTLMSIRNRMDVPCSTNLATFDLETEVFLHILKNCLEYVQGEADLTDPQQAASVACAHEGDGMSTSSRKSQRGGHWTERVMAPFRFGFKELAPTLAKLGSAMTITAVGRGTAQQLAAQLVSSHLKYQAALRASTAVASQSGSGMIAGWGKRAVLDAAQRGLTTATARYSAIQGALSFLGPVMWGWLALDLAYKAIGTDYARVIRAVFILAQVRLVSTGGFIQPSHAQPSSHSAQQQHAQHAHASQQYQQQQQQQRWRSNNSASNQEVVVEGDAAGHKGVVSAVVPYGCAAAAAATAAAAVEAAGGWHGGHASGGWAAVQAESWAAAQAESWAAVQAERYHAGAEGEAQARAAGEEAARVAAALEVHPHRFRHLLDCSEELCDDEEQEAWRLYGCGSDSEEDPFCDSVC